MQILHVKSVKATPDLYVDVRRVEVSEWIEKIKNGWSQFKALNKNFIRDKNLNLIQKTRVMTCQRIKDIKIVLNRQMRLKRGVFRIANA